VTEYVVFAVCLLLLWTAAERSTTAESAIKTSQMSNLSRNAAAKHASFCLLSCTLVRTSTNRLIDN